MSRQLLTQRIHGFIQNCLDLLFPPHCTICQKSGHVLCPDCLATIARFVPPLCMRCGSSLVRNICYRCRRQPLRLTGLRAVGLYQEPLRTCIHALKYKGQQRLAEPLGRLLAQTYQLAGIKAHGIIPMPLHSEREYERGYNQSRLLAHVCSQHIGVPLIEGILLRTRATAAQVHLAAHERQRNVAHAFQCVPSASTIIKGRTILIIDDVCTTASTLEACAEPLFTAGASAVWGLVLARA